MEERPPFFFPSSGALQPSIQLEILLSGKVIVKTPAGGILARAGMTVYSAICDRYFEIDSATVGQKTLTVLSPGGTAEKIRVYNFANGDVAGDKMILALKQA